MRKPAVGIQEALGANQLPHSLICATPFEAIPNLKPFRFKIILKRILLKDETIAKTS